MDRKNQILNQTQDRNVMSYFKVKYYVVILFFRIVIKNVFGCLLKLRENKYYIPFFTIVIILTNVTIVFFFSMTHAFIYTSNLSIVWMSHFILFLIYHIKYNTLCRSNACINPICIYIYIYTNYTQTAVKYNEFSKVRKNILQNVY